MVNMNEMLVKAITMGRRSGGTREAFKRLQWLDQAIRVEGVRRREGVRHMEQLSAAVQRRNEDRGRGGGGVTGGAAAAAAAAEDAAEEGEGGGGVELIGRSVGRRHHADPHRHAPGAHSHRAPGTRAAMRAALAAASPAGLAAAARAEE